jgi:nucleoside-diphosphate-sugar epimerase
MAAAAIPDGPVLITGAAGFAGGHLAELLASNPSLVCWSREAPAPGLVPSARWEQIDLLDRHQVRGAVSAVRPAQIYHLAGVPHVGGSWDATTPTLAGNVLATHYLFDATRRAFFAYRVEAGTMLISGDPVGREEALPGLVRDGCALAWMRTRARAKTASTSSWCAR